MINPSIFREYDIRGVAETDLTDAAVERIGKAYGTYLQNKLHGHSSAFGAKKKIVLGRDGRLSSPRIREALMRGILSTGIHVTDLGIITTPILYFSIVHLKMEGGIMVTGSHNPREFNGLKICVGKDTIHGSEIQSLRKLAEGGNFTVGQGELDHVEVITVYQKFLKEKFVLKRKLKVVVDAGNGTASVVAPKLFRDLGCEVTELFCDLDGNFPNHFPDPTEEKNLKDLMGKVVALQADLGIAFDGDADRLGVVNEKGQIIYGDRMLLLFARDLLADKKGVPIIGEVKCSKILFEDIARHGGQPIMWKAGHSLIKAKMRETGAPLAGEMSGHFFFGDRYFGFDDGVYAACRTLDILSKTGKPLSVLFEDVPELYSTPEMRVDCPDARKFEIVRKAVEYFKKSYDVIDIDGARINFPDGWGLVRASNTQPVLVMRFEANSKSKLEQIQSLVEGKIREFSKEPATRNPNDMKGYESL